MSSTSKGIFAVSPNYQDRSLQFAISSPYLQSVGIYKMYDIMRNGYITIDSTSGYMVPNIETPNNRPFVNGRRPAASSASGAVTILPTDKLLSPGNITIPAGASGAAGVWSAYFDTVARRYFYVNSSGASQYDHPFPPKFSPSDPLVIDKSTDYLIPGWIKFKSTSPNQPALSYYLNTATTETTWTHPNLPPDPASSTLQPDATLKSPWKKYTSTSGATFYANSMSGEAQWEFPEIYFDQAPSMARVASSAVAQQASTAQASSAVAQQVSSAQSQTVSGVQASSAFIQKDSSAQQQRDSSAQTSSAQQQRDSSAQQQRSSSAVQQSTSSAQQQRDSSAQQQSLSGAQQQKDSSAQQQFVSGAQSSSAIQQKDSSAQQQRDSSAVQQSTSGAQQQRDSSAQQQRDSSAKQQRDSSALQQFDSSARQQRDSSAVQQFDSSARQQRDSSAKQQRDSSAVQQFDSGAQQQRESSATQKSASSAQKQAAIAAALSNKEAIKGSTITLGNQIAQQLRNIYSSGRPLDQSTIASLQAYISDFHAKKAEIVASAAPIFQLTPNYQDSQLQTIIQDPALRPFGVRKAFDILRNDYVFLDANNNIVNNPLTPNGRASGP